MVSNRDPVGSPPRFFGLPRTPSGRWAMGLALAFSVLFPLWLFYVTATPGPRPTFFSDPLHAVLILAAAASAIAGAIVGVSSIVLRRERSFLVLLSIGVGTIVALWTLAELWGH